MRAVNGSRRQVGRGGSGEERLQAVVVLLRNGIELVIVAAGAADGGAGEGLHRGAHHVVAVDVANSLLFDGAFADFDLSDPVERACCDEAEGDDAVLRAGVEHVAGELLPHELRERLVLVKSANDVIAIRPGVGADLVLVVAVRVTVVNDIEPVPRPSLAVVG